MTFEELLDQAIAMLQRRGRLTYRTLALHFQLDGETFEALKAEMLYSQEQIVDDPGRGLLWTGNQVVPEVSRPAVTEGLFSALCRAVSDRLRAEKRLTYRDLKHAFGLDNALLEEIRQALTFTRLAVDEGGEGLVWTGEAPSHAPPAAPLVPPLVTGTAPQTAVPVAPAVDAPGEVASTGTLLVPEPMYSTPDAERRQLTVMFCDLVGSTDLSGRLDPEDLRQVVRAYQQAAAAVIQQYEGHIAQYLGDGLLSYFGYPVAHEDDAPRAVHSGLGIVEALDTLNSRLQADYGVELAVRIGIHTGPVVVGAMGGGSRQEHLALGETPNIAARLEGLAAPNTVVISAVTARLVQRTFHLQDLGLQALKGVSEPMALAWVLSAREREAIGPALRGFETLVGREEEIGLLVRCWEHSKTGLGQVVLLSGEAGIGKSSLVDGLRVQVRQEGMTRITLRCSPYHTQSALYPIIAHLQHALDWQPDDTTESRLRKLEQGLAGTDLALAEAVPLLASLLALSLPEERYPTLTLSPQQQRQQTQDVLVAWLSAAADRCPVLAVWEDLHWADPSTLEVLGLFIDQAPTARMLHVLTCRPTFLPPWPARSHLTPITLNRLERPQVEALLGRLTNGKALPQAVVEHIVGKTDGVPLYVEELTKMLLTSGLLQEEAAQYTLTGPLSSATIPETLQDALMARLDQLQGAKEIAQLGAVLGREFSYTLLQEISDIAEPQLQAGLAALVTAELLYQRGRPPRARYLFKHALIQDAAYASLLRSTRQHLHERMARLLETRFPETAVTQPDLVAHHYTEAGLQAQALPYWQQAGQRANARSAHAEAEAHLTTGLEVLKMLPDTPERAQHELALHLNLGPALMATRGHHTEEVERVYTRARQLCQQVGETPQLFAALAGLHRFYYVRGALHTARELGEQFLTLARRQEDTALLLTGHWMMGTPLLWLGDVATAHEHFEQTRAHFDPQQHRGLALRYGLDPGSAARVFTALTLWTSGYPEQALQRSQEALTLAQELAHPFSQAYVLFCVALFHWLRRDAQSTSAYVEACIALATERGFPIWIMAGTWLRGAALARQGHLDEGIARLLQGLNMLRATRTALLDPMILLALAETHIKAGRPEVGCELLVDAQDTVDRTAQHFWKAEAYRLQGECLRVQSEANAAAIETCFRQALDIARQQQAKSWELRAATSLARLWHSQGKRQEATDLLAPVYGWFTEGFDTADVQAAKGLLHELGG